MELIRLDTWPKPEMAWHVLGPNPNEDGTHLIQKQDGTFHLFFGSTTKGWFGSKKWEN